MFGNKKDLERKLSDQGGTVAWATVLEAHTQFTSGTNYENGPYTVGNHDHMKVTLRVEPDGEQPFEATFHQTFAGASPIQGFQAKVIYDPADHSKIAILEGQVFPPGITHEQAEHSAARRQQMEAALASGNMANFIAETRAAAIGAALPATGGDAPAPDLADQLTKLADLKDRGVLSDAEFETAKAKLLAAG